MDKPRTNRQENRNSRRKIFPITFGRETSPHPYLDAIRYGHSLYKKLREINQLHQFLKLEHKSRRYPWAATRSDLLCNLLSALK